MNATKASDALFAIPCASASYEKWVKLAIAFKAAGGVLSDWDTWCRTDPARYDERAARDVFENPPVGVTRGGGSPVTELTLWKWAQDEGWRDPDYTGGAEHQKSKPKNEVEPEPPKLGDLSPGEQAALQIEALFAPGDTVNIVSMAKYDEGKKKWHPIGKGGFYDRDRLAEGFRRDGIEATIGAYNPDAGVWLRINPTDGQGISDSNITTFRNVLIEGDDQSEQEQLSMMLGMKLPLRAVVESGGKSVHGNCRIDADGANHYADRVADLYRACRERGLKVDEACGNPSRLCRLAGATRGARTQSLVYTNVGEPTYQAWKRAHEAHMKQLEGQGKYQHNVVGEKLIDEYKACFVDGTPAVWRNGAYLFGATEFEKVIVDCIRRDATEAQRKETIKYLNLRAPHKEPPPRNLLAFKNGILDIDTMKFSKPEKNDVYMNVIPHDWNPNATDETVTKVLRKIASGNDAVFANLCEIVGFCMYRGSEFPMVALLTGGGANGKSTFVNMLYGALGEDNYSTVTLHSLGARFQTIPLMGKLANIGDEIPSHMVDAGTCATVKALTGGSMVQAEYKNGITFGFRPYTTLVYNCNKIPRFADTTYGFMRRLLPVPLEATFTKDDADYDPNIGEKLATESAMQAFIRLGVEHLRAALERKEFTPNKLSDEVRHDIKRDNDNVFLFVEEEFTEQCETMHGHMVSSVYDDYRAWCDQCGNHAVSRNMFSRRVHEMGYTTEKRHVPNGGGRKENYFIKRE